MDDLLTFLGLILIVEGLPYLAFPSRVKRWAESLIGMDDTTMRVIGVMATAGGIILVYIGRRILSHTG